ncbi:MULTISPECIES: ATP-binding protein [unclassified Streptomyces]|uniref:ATP-binding protein n=1 Tax=unclassified Streptomyces TaxID=2593676 RepID=UPI003D75FFA9
MTTEALTEPPGPFQVLETGLGSREAVDGHLDLRGMGSEDVSRVRHLAQAFLARLHVPSSMCEDALLVISELVTNAVTHARPPAVLRIRCAPCMLRIEVTDGGPRLRQSPRTDPMEEHGRGMYIVAALASRHGTSAHENGATRWAELSPHAASSGP